MHWLWRVKNHQSCPRVTHEGMGYSGGRHPLIPNLCIRRIWVVSSTILSHYLWGMSPWKPSVGRYMNHTTSLENKERRKISCISYSLDQCFSTFVRLRPGKFFFVRRGPGPNKFTRKYLSIFLSSYIKLT